MTWGAVAGAAVSVVGGAIAADSASSAAGSMQGASDQSTQAQMIAAAQMRADLQPWVTAGSAAQSRLNQYLGLGGVGSSGRTSMGLATGLTPDQVRQQLLSRYTRQSSAPNAAPMYRTGADAVAALGAQGAHDYFQSQSNAQRNVLTGDGGINSGQPGIGPGYWLDNNDATGQRRWVSTGSGDAAGPSSTIDEEGLNAAIAKYYEEQDAQNRAAESDPTYGSLLRAYRNGEEFSFTGEDLENDPGYKFGLDQGTQSIQRGQAARGNFLSGAAMKELSRFGQDYAGTKFDNAYSRNLSTWNTNRSAYDTNRNTIYSFLTGQSTMGQNSAARVGTNNQQVAANVGNNIMGAGNVQAASTIAGGNALASGLNGAVNAYNTGNGLSSAAGWNSLISSGGSPYGGSSMSVTPGATWTPPTNVFAGGNAMIG